MPFDRRPEVPRPDLADTPELFDRIESGLRREAAQIRERHLARQRRRSWFDHLRPVMNAGAAVAVAIVLFPLAQALLAGQATPQPVVEQTVGDTSGVTAVELRLPSAYLDVNLIGRRGVHTDVDTVDRMQMLPIDDRTSDMVAAPVA